MRNFAWLVGIVWCEESGNPEMDNTRAVCLCYFLFPFHCALLCHPLVMELLPPWATQPKKHRDLLDREGRFAGRVYSYLPLVFLPGWKADGTVMSHKFECVHWNPGPGEYLIVFDKHAPMQEISLDLSGLITDKYYLKSVVTKKLNQVFKSRGSSVKGKIQFCAFVDESGGCKNRSHLLHGRVGQVDAWTDALVCGPFSTFDCSLKKRIRGIIEDFAATNEVKILSLNYRGHPFFGIPTISVEDSEEEMDENEEFVLNAEFSSSSIERAHLDHADAGAG